MPARTVPESPKFEHETEREVWAEVCRQLPSDAVVVANLRLTNAKKDHELDLVALVPGHGMVVVEVKGGSVWLEGTTWMRRQRSGPTAFDPVDQARGNLYALRAYIETDPRWKNSSRSRFRQGWSVALPRTDLDDDFATPASPRWMVHGKNDLRAIGKRLVSLVDQQDTHHRVFDLDDLDLVLEILDGRKQPAYDPNADAEEMEAEAEALTLEQSTLLKVTRLLNRVEVRGGAGSGKTVLALTQASQRTRGGQGVPTERVALLCYSIGLAEHLKREVAQMPRKARPAFVGTFEELSQEWGSPGGSRTDPDFFEHRLPADMADRALLLPDEKKFDSVIVDEAQDFADSWWIPLMRALRDEEQGGLFVYNDENQRVFDRFGRPPVPLVPLVLDHNLRNTKQIAAAFGPLAPMRMRALGGEGPEVSFVPVNDKTEAVGAVDDQVLAILEEGWDHRHIAVITTGSRHPEQMRQQESRSMEDYWKDFWDGKDVFYGHVLACKGLERRAVVLCVNQEDVSDRSRERLYVGMSRATQRLVVVGVPEVVREMGGEQVARQLGL